MFEASFGSAEFLNSRVGIALIRASGAPRSAALIWCSSSLRAFASRVPSTFLGSRSSSARKKIECGSLGGSFDKRDRTLNSRGLIDGRSLTMKGNEDDGIIIPPPLVATPIPGC